MYKLKILTITLIMIFVAVPVSALEITGTGDTDFDNQFELVEATEIDEVIHVANTNKWIGSFETKFSSKQANRNTNIKLASDAINNIVVNPGDKFSFNCVTGKRTTGKGYKSAPVISGGKHVMGTGGGVCQVSTTLFNASVKSGMTITERHNHGFKSTYVSAGADATVSYGSLDFCFVNPYDYPVVIKSEVKDNKITVSIYGDDSVEYPEISTGITCKNRTYKYYRESNGEVDYVTTSRYK